MLGEKIKSAQNHLTGVDISAKMLEKAEQKHIYDQLVQADIAAYCQNLPAADLITAADVIGYIGDITALTKNIFPHRFAFSAAIDNNIKNGFMLTEGGRYIYRSDYIEQTLSNSGYKNIRRQSAILRTENGQDIKGIIFEAKEN